MIQHRIERHKEKLRVTLELDLVDVVQGLTDDVYAAELERYCAAHIVPDVMEVGEILLKEDSELGTVRWFSEARGYGFIRSYDGRDIFVHYSGIAGSGYKTLQQGQKVRFKCRVGRQLSATDVTLVDPAGEAPASSSGAPGSSLP